MAAKDPHIRTEVARRGGEARIANADPTELAAARRAGAAAANRPLALARRIARAWAGLTDDERAEVLAILAPLMKKRPAPTRPVEPGKDRRRAAVV